MSIEDNINYGFVKLFRSIKKHWLWKDPQKLQWWIDILLEVNHSDEKVLIGNELIECKKGQSIKSLKTWSKEWKVSVGTVKRFFDLLEKDSMVKVETLTKTTRLNVSQYCVYADWRNADGTVAERRRNADGTQTETNNNGNNDNKENIRVAKATEHDQKLKYGFVIKTDLLKVCEFITENKPSIAEPYVDLWNLFCDSRLAGNRKVDRITDKRRNKIRTRIREQRFDMQKILSTAKTSNFLINDFDGFDFDWIVYNEENYEKVLRGRYGNDISKDEIKQHHDNTEYLKKRQEAEKRNRERIDGSSATA